MAQTIFYDMKLDYPMARYVLK